MRAVLLDFDGTLLDSFADIVSTANHVLSTFGRAELPQEVVKSYVGDGLPHLLKKCFEHEGCAEELLEPAIACFEAHYAEHGLSQSNLFDGARPLLEKLVASGRPVALVSNKREKACHKLLDDLDIKGMFGAVVGGDTYPLPKPSPVPLKGALERLGVTSEGAQMVGDGTQDVGAGRALGLKTCGVLWGIGTRETLTEAGADQIVADFDALERWLELA